MKKHIVSTLIIILIVSFNAIAKDNIPNPNNSNNNSYRLLASGCVEATAQSILEVNNVRTTILAGGDMWWDLDNAKYEIPKDSDRHSMFAGALWIGGLDEQGKVQKIQIYPKNSKAMNLAFDVTPAKYITKLITEKGVCEASKKGLNNLFK